jgi:hypothetical protein
MSSSFLSTFQNFPVNDPPELERVLVQTYTEIALASNSKENSQYETVETVTGQQFYDLVNPEQKRFTFRKCLETGALGVGLTNIPHGIVGATDFTYIGGTVAFAGNVYAPLPYLGFGVGDYISIFINGANIEIHVGPAMPAILSGRVVLEYFKN